ncbi:MAG TPA: putative peptidoglycan glycosyltransferase FtsW [Pseudonocardiaceae bacterium]|nr:putative peptidoglycan glycosyltransferase FtsW [Pseudonocardiaceae bacterium]
MKLGSVRTAFGPLTAWLGRPLASFHLILAVFGLLTAIGLVMVASASPIVSLQPSGTGSAYALFKKQLAFALLGLLVFWLGVRIPLHRIRALSGYAVAGTIVMLVAVLGIHTNTRGFLPLGPLAFQPVELAKLALALWGAHVLVKKKALLHQYRHLLVPLVPVGLLMLTLVILQPDFGSTVTLGIVLLSLLWFIGAPMRLFVSIVVGAVGGAIALSVGALYRSARITAFFHPSQDTKGLNYQAIEGKYALADGGLFGQGLGQGAAKYGYLPNVHTDFIFALIGEELGFVGCALVLGLFVMLAITGMRIAMRNIDPWIKVVAGTLTTWLIAQAAINIGCVLSLLPDTGIPLPMISYGGTSLVVTMLVFGLLANCARHEPESVAALRAVGPGKFGTLMRLPAPNVYQPPVRRKPARPSSPPRGAGRPGGSGGNRSSGLPPAEERRRAGRSGAGDRRRSTWRGEERWGPGRYGSTRAAGRTAEGGGR